ncbi:putative epimerase/dehydratase [Variibacter gotjawalensis]|uniref:Putative epimerase/dehydratase n=1 Tax=Variibacter gotjawalensis TaxID=1333996 RepID=A0A0S3Q0D4_9BRAD|nr:NAD(P)-dependent oxidoreductase [Variibacter gotjawalensis]NIK47470.1 uronate dehydrogenase [Variibacter gotjawalensis]RZS49365.1 uronate dehydrogenase [Variibacter gotjawalensis]BAT61629.1 putative epimerase/dehydratase [Variibacter gotjawalensis]
MRVLMTGAAGQIGRETRAQLKGRYELMRLTDIIDGEPAKAGEDFIRADLTDLAAMERMMAGIDCVVHLGGMSVEPKENQWEQVLSANIVGTHNVFEAARRANVGRVVFASSHHAVGYHRRAHVLDGSALPRPDSFYGVSKVTGEALGRLYADKFGMSVVSLRIGAFRPKPLDARHLSVWISPRDMVELIRCSIEAPKLHYVVAYGMSANTRAFWDNRDAYVLGYRPQDNAEDYAEEVLTKGEPELEGAKPFHGGWYCGWYLGPHGLMID